MVVRVSTPLDYALLAAGGRALAARHGWSGCWPVLEAQAGAWAPAEAAARYGTRELGVEELLGGASAVERARSLAEQVATGPQPAVGVAAEAGLEPIVAALALALERGELLAVGSQTRAPEEPAAPASWRGQPLVLARQGSLHALPAALYAATSGKRFLAVAELAAVPSWLVEAPPSSLLLADDLATFTKAVLEDWLEASQAVGFALGVLTGRDAAQSSSVVCRLLAHRAFAAAGGRLAEPEGLAPIPVREMPALEFYLLGAHGNEMHLRHKGEEVLCGASARRRQGGPGFDCEPRCRFPQRVRASELPAHAVLLLSCDAFTAGEGLLSPDFNLMLTLLDGWTAAVLAPYKHVQGGEATVLLAAALVASGASLGEVALTLNSLCRLGTAPDPGYLVLGDPDRVPHPLPPPDPPELGWVASDGGLALHFQSSGRRVFELRLGAGALEERPGEGQILALEPLSEPLAATDVFFALRREPSGALALTLFSNRALPSGRLELWLGAAPAADPAEIARAREQVARVRFLAAIGVDRAEVRAVEEELLSLLRAAVGYPRAIEMVLGASVVRHLGAVLEARGEELRRRLLEAIRTAMARTRLWISQCYGGAYARLERAGGTAASCQACGNRRVVWRFEDPLGELESRHLTLCSRCGIVADEPAEPELELALAGPAVGSGSELHFDFAIANRTARALALSAFLQCNQWQDLGFKADPERLELALEPGESARGEVRLSAAEPPPDDILQVQLFVLTDSYRLHFAGLKVPCQRAPELASPALVPPTPEALTRGG